MIFQTYTINEQGNQLSVSIPKDEFFVDNRKDLLAVLEKMANDIRREIAIEQGSMVCQQWPTSKKLA